MRTFVFSTQFNKMIDQPTIDRILDAANVVDVVSDFVTLHKKGVNFVGLCPFHTDSSPSFYVSPAKNICKCFACGEGGTAVHFIMKHEQVNYFDALRFLAKKYHIEIQERELTDKQKQRQSDRESMLIVNSWAQKYFSDQLHQHEEGKKVAYRYFQERGFRDDIIRKFQLGYCLDKRDAMFRESEKKGYKKEYLEKTGLVYVYENGQVNDRFRGRVIFPVHGLSGKVVAFGGRTLKKDDKTAKYVNSPESEIYHKSNELYGIYFAKQAIVKSDRCFLVEGYTDVISMHQAGIENVVASSGTALTQPQIRLIHRFTNNITVLYDGDAAGIKAALRGIDLILEEGMNIKVVLLPDGEDPDSFARKHNATAFSDFIKQNETDFIRFKTKLLLDEAGDDPIKRSTLISDIIRTIAIIPDNIARSLYVRECSSMMAIEEKIILNEVNKQRLEKLEKNSSVNSVKPTQTTVTDVQPTDSFSPQATITGDPANNVGQQSNQPSPYDPYEQCLIKYIIRYGERVIFDYVDEETEESVQIRVAEYIRRELQQDEIMFSLPVYNQIIEEAIEKSGQPDFNCQRYFLYHQDLAISRMAANMVSEKYQLSKYHTKFKEIDTEETKLSQYVVKDIFALKDAIISHHINEIKQNIKILQSEKNLEKAYDLMQQLTELIEIKSVLSKELGERIVLKM